MDVFEECHVFSHLLRALLARHARDPVASERRRLARGLEALRHDARCASPLSVVSRSVAAACEPAAVRMARILRDERTDVDPDVLRRIREFLTCGATSPLYGRDPASAFLAIATLERDLSGTSPRDTVHSDG